MITPFDLEGRVIIGPSPGSPLGGSIDAAFERGGSHYNPDIEVRFSNVAAPLVAQGLGVGLVDELTAKYRPELHYTIHQFSPRVPIKVCGLVIRGKPVPRLVQAFLKIPDPVKRAELIRMAEDYVRRAR